MSSMSRFALKEFKLNTCDAYYRQSSSLSSRRLRTHLGMFDFYTFTFWVSVFCAFWQLGSINLVPWQLKFTDFSVPILRGLWQFLVSLCFKHFIFFSFQNWMIFRCKRWNFCAWQWKKLRNPKQAMESYCCCPFFNCSNFKVCALGFVLLLFFVCHFHTCLINEHICQCQYDQAQAFLANMQPCGNDRRPSSLLSRDPNKLLCLKQCWYPYMIYGEIMVQYYLNHD